MQNFQTYDFWKFKFIAIALVTVACETEKVPFQTELHVQVKVSTPSPVVEAVIEPSPTPEMTPTPPPVVAKVKEAPKKKPVQAPTSTPNDTIGIDQMQRDLDKQIAAWTKRKVMQDELEAQIPEIKIFQQKAKLSDIDATTKAYFVAKRALEDFKIDSSFIAKKVERTLLLLNKSKLPPEKYTELQNRIEKLEKSINEEKYLLVNEELTALQDEINDAAKLEDVFERN